MYDRRSGRVATPRFLAFIRFGGHVVMVDLTPFGRIVPTAFLDVVDEAASRAEAALG